MKKVFLVLAFVALATTGNSQIYYHHYNSKPWDGNKSYILNAGLDFSLVEQDFGSSAKDITVNPGFAASFRYEGDKNINENFSWGYQFELSYLAQGVKYSKLDANTATIKHSDLSWWDLGIDVRLSLSYWIGDAVELQVAAGLYNNPFFGIKGESWETNAFGAEVNGSRKDVGGSTFNLSTGVSTTLQAKYFFNENFFVSLNVHDNIALNLFSKDFDEDKDSSKGGQRGIVMFGIGYKFIR